MIKFTTRSGGVLLMLKKIGYFVYTQLALPICRGAFERHVEAKMKTAVVFERHAEAKMKTAVVSSYIKALNVKSQCN